MLSKYCVAVLAASVTSMAFASPIYAAASFVSGFDARNVPSVVTRSQAGSMGGSIGVQEKSVSGDRDAPKSAPPARKRSAPEPRPAAPKRAAPVRERAEPARTAASYDGLWSVTNYGCGAGSGTVAISSGRVSGGAVTGTVSSSGAIRTYSSTSVGSGRASGRSASGTFRTNDGCTGRWTAVKQ